MDFKNLQNPLIVRGKNCLSSYQNVLKMIEDWIKQRDTKRYFTKIWNRNVFFNVQQKKKLLVEWSPPVESSVAILVSTGPSLESEVQKLIDCKKKLQKKLCVVAVPAAVEFLHSVNIHPDFIISTDGGIHNDYHFRYLSRIKYQPPLISSCSVQKNIIKNYRGEVFLFFDDFSWIEKKYFDLLKKKDISNLWENYIPASSSVTGSALRVLQYFFYTHIATIGVDFWITPFLFHASSNTSEEYFFQKGCRLYPFEHWHQQTFFQKLIKLEKMWGEPKLDVYRNQFQKILTEKNTSSVDIDTLKKVATHKRLVPLEIEKKRNQSIFCIKKFLREVRFESY